MGDPATNPTASRRSNDAALRRSTVMSSLLALILVGATAAIIAVIVLRTPAPAVDPIGEQDPVGVARAASRDLAMDSAFTEEPPVAGGVGDSRAVTARPQTAAVHDTTSPVQPPTPTPRIMSLPTVAVPTQLPSKAAAGTHSGEYWGVFHFGPYSPYGADAARATPRSATAAQAALMATPTVAPTPPGTLEVGTRVVVIVPSARLRNAPSLDGLVVAGLPQGRALVITGPPVAGSGYVWYPVEVRKEPGLAGYVAADLLAPKAS